jgi:hypothetical protein
VTRVGQGSGRVRRPEPGRDQAAFSVVRHEVIVRRGGPPAGWHST